MTPPKIWKGRDPSERRTAANNIFVPRGFTEDFLEAMQELRDGAKEGAEASCLVVVGERGVGKSALLKQYAAEYPSLLVDDGFIRTLTRPVVYVSFPSSPTLKGAAEAFLQSLCGDASLRGSRSTLTLRIKEQLKLLKVELVIADEFQHVRDEGAHGQSEVAAWLKDIIKQTNVPFVLSGMPETVNIIQADDQLHSLTLEPTIITPYTWSDPPSRLAWKALLAEIDKALPFDMRSKLAETETARQLFNCTRGYMRQLVTLLRVATARAIRNNAACLIWDDLAAGYNRMPKSELAKGNPFDRNGLFSGDKK